MRFPRRKEEKVGEQKSSLSFPKHLRKIVPWKQKERAAAVSCSFPFPQKRNSRLPPSFSHTERRKKTARRERRKVGGRMRWRGGTAMIISSKPAPASPGAKMNLLDPQFSHFLLRKKPLPFSSPSLISSLEASEVNEGLAGEEKNRYER